MLQIHNRLADRLAANQIGDQPGFARGNMHIARNGGYCAGFSVHQSRTVNFWCVGQFLIIFYCCFRGHKLSCGEKLRRYFLSGAFSSATGLAAAAAASVWLFAILPPWPVNLRVGENSPKRWPTIFSVMKTGV